MSKHPVPDCNGRYHDDDGRYISLREYFERLLVEHDKAHAVEHKAVELQAKEYERRLTSLNHAHEEAARIQQTYVTNEKYENRIAAVDLAVQSLDDDLSKKIESLSQWMAVHRELPVHPQAAKDIANIFDRLGPLEAFRGRAALIAAGLMAISGVVGAAIMRAIGI